MVLKDKRWDMGASDISAFDQSISGHKCFFITLQESCSQLEAIASRLEAIATWVKAIASYDSNFSFLYRGGRRFVQHLWRDCMVTKAQGTHGIWGPLEQGC